MPAKAKSNETLFMLLTTIMKKEHAEQPILVFTEVSVLNSIGQRIDQVSPWLEKALSLHQAMGIGRFPDGNFDSLLANPENWLNGQILATCKAHGLHQRGPFTVRVPVPGFAGIQLSGRH